MCEKAAIRELHRQFRKEVSGRTELARELREHDDPDETPYQDGYIDGMQRAFKILHPELRGLGD